MRLKYFAIKVNVLKNIFIVFVFSIITVYAQNEDPAIEASKEEQQKKSETETDKKLEDEFITPDTFDPTEKLSEDIPVDFPVDI